MNRRGFLASVALTAAGLLHAKVGKWLPPEDGDDYAIGADLAAPGSEDYSAIVLRSWSVIYFRSYTTFGEPIIIDKPGVSIVPGPGATLVNAPRGRIHGYLRGPFGAPMAYTLLPEEEIRRMYPETA